MLPSPLSILAGVVVTFFVVLTIARGPVDADYWWHLATGQMILETGSIPTTDPFSFAYDGPWVAHEWLGEVVIAALVGSVGYGATAVLFGLAAAAAVLLPSYALSRRGVRTAALVPFVATATYGLASYATVRPQVLSWLLLAGLLVLLIGVRPEHRLRPWLVVPLFVLWANVHGLYVIGLGVLLLYVAFTLARRSPMASRRWVPVGMLGGAIVASALTPAGAAGLLYPLRYIRQDDWGTAFIAEWQSIDLADPRQWAVVALIAAGILLVRRVSIGWETAAGVAGILGAVIAVRNGPIAMITGLPMLAPALDDWLASRRGSRAVADRRRRVVELIAGAAIVAATLVILPGAASGSEAETFPTEAFDALETADPDANLLVEYDWAGYAINRLHGRGGQVFIDGRSDMYPRKVFEEYVAMRGAEGEWRSRLDARDVEAILFRPSAPLVQAAVEAGWCEAYADTEAVLLLPCEAG